MKDMKQYTAHNFTRLKHAKRLEVEGQYKKLGGIITIITRECVITYMNRSSLVRCCSVFALFLIHFDMAKIKKRYDNVSRQYKSATTMYMGKVFPSYTCLFILVIH